MLIKDFPAAFKYLKRIFICRVFVQRGIYDEFIKSFVSQCQKMKAGDPFDESTTVGATITKEHAEKVQKHFNFHSKNLYKI